LTAAAKPGKALSMAVYTEVADEDLAAFVAEYDLGAVLSCKGIAEGVENSNFLLVTEAGPYILTLYEKRTRKEDLPFFLGLMEHLSRRGMAVPLPVAGRDGVALRELCGRSAAIVTFLQGMWPRQIHPWHCGPLGEAMARMHLAGADFALSRPNTLSLSGWRDLVAKCRPRADEVADGLSGIIAEELAWLEANWPAGLPQGVIHADLFPDNVFYLGQRWSGFIDFYFACNDALAYDLAICLNAWCFEPTGEFNITKAGLLLAGYRSVRPLSPEELAALPALCRGSALRFLLTRLYDWLNHPPGAFVKPKDPREYLRKLRFHQRIAGVEGYGIDPAVVA
jgi:homoserine kinase type II